MDKKFVVTGCICIVFGIILGAFGAHGLKSILDNFPEKIASFETGVRYQIYSGFSFLILGLNANKIKFSLKLVFVFWLLGTIFFSFSIYFLAISPILTFSVKFLGPITPFGGLFIIIGWFILLLKVIQTKH